jgi:DNA polymerase-1
VQKAAERAAINAPMQGTAADLIKKAMVAVQRWLQETGAKSRLILQVHDELILEVPEVEVEQVREALPRLMSEVAELKVPLVAEVGVADNWEAAH